MFFGPRWAYPQQVEILGDRLDGVIFPSRTAVDRHLNQMLPLLLARREARERIDQNVT